MGDHSQRAPPAWWLGLGLEGLSIKEQAVETDLCGALGVSVASFWPVILSGSTLSLVIHEESLGDDGAVPWRVAGEAA
ncbi:uncharacterized protein H6S33_000303 [Morchella sextelata]|uniref:uncharacterized protein n=1 Tax=Morchella sextelata TaxID=1174677 RepID=UPI001D05B29A|nr:uncharacterized protein H6S33_000303 [Morchella sextelata]KAH0614667.1 hypothetical protein H6S33_000303 [Morchella sextelata]